MLQLAGATRLPAQPSRVPMALAVLLAHAALGWLAWQAAPLRHKLTEAVPLMVRLVSLEPAPQPPQPTPPPPPTLARPMAPLLPPPEIVTQPQAPAVPRQPVQAEARPEPTPPAPTAVATAPAPVVAAAPAPAPPPPRPAAPPVLSGAAVRYLVPPPLEVPLASRRLGETGAVTLRVLVGTDGAPRQISVHKTSGFARLDDAARAAMAHARFQPLVIDGVATECVVIAPLQFELD